METGRYCSFAIQGPDSLYELKPNPAKQKKYLALQKINEGSQIAPTVGEHDANTERFLVSTRGMLHIEGGWPKDIDPREPDQLNMFRKKVERDENFLGQLANRTAQSMGVLNQNLSLDIYQKYFDDYQENVSSELPHATIQAVLRDPYASSNRWAANISWHPDERNKVAVAYSILRFQDTALDMPPTSYIWDLNNPNNPLMSLNPLSPLCSLQYNFKDFNIIVGGCYNGFISIWDMRKGSTPSDTVPIEKSHSDPVYRVQWLQSKTGAECASISSDGTVKWWDIRKLAEPIEYMELMNKVDGSKLGGTSMDYDPALGSSKFMTGTEQGICLSCNRKAKTNAEKVSTPFVGHIGPVYAVQRNPTHSRYFLSVGDWSARLWMDDLRVPIWTTPFDTTYMSTGCWSPSRAALFFTAKKDGTLDAWDMLTQQRLLNLQVTENRKIGLIALEVHSSGRLVASGCTDGSVHIHELSDTLSLLQPNEKTDLLTVFEREAKREKNIDSRNKEMRLKEKQASNRPGSKDGGRISSTAQRQRS
ncbi:MAG: putative Dynein intermediate chain 3, ciliary, partial [Streblomastix strix]